MDVLVVDPNVAFATLLSEELTRQGYGVDVCISGMEALAMVQRRHPDLAVLDMALVDPDALEVARALRRLHPSLKLMLIPLIGEQLSAEARSLSIQGVLPKPFFLPELPERISKAMGTAVNSPGGIAAPIPAAVPSSPVPVRESDSAKTQVAPRPADHAPAPMLLPGAPKAASADPEPPVSGEGFSLLRFRAARERIEVAMYSLLQEVQADAVLLTYDQGLLTWVGDLEEDEAESISQVVVAGWRTSAEVARILGREQLRFEQSLAGGSYMLYALGVDSMAILAVAVRGMTPLGLLRHQARAAADSIAKLCGA